MPKEQYSTYTLSILAFHGNIRPLFGSQPIKLVLQPNERFFSLSNFSQNTIRFITVSSAFANVVTNISGHVNFRRFKVKVVSVYTATIVTQMRQIQLVGLVGLQP